MATHHIPTVPYLVIWIITTMLTTTIPTTAIPIADTAMAHSATIPGPGATPRTTRRRSDERPR